MNPKPTQPQFQRKIEDFTCENCGTQIEGDGYTNHCPKCLYSKHVDINPGDRAEKCGGLMKPTSIEKSGDVINIIHECTKCGFTRRNRTHKNDNFEKIIEISKQENL